MKYEITRSKYLLSDELIALNSVLLKYPNRDTALILLALHTGARANELLKITVKDLNDTFQSVFIQGSKKSKEREIPVSPEIYDLIKAHIPFNISYRRLSQIWDYYKPVNKTFHSLRHTFAINLYKHTKDIKLVQICLGHKSITSTQVYSDFIYEQSEMRRLIIPKHTSA